MGAKCSSCSKIYDISEKENDLKAKFGLSEVNICSDCMLKNVLAFWPSIGKWYKRKCDFSGETIITNYPENARFPVYKSNYFESDKWTPEYLEIDYNKSFFSQLKELQEKVPRPHMLGINNENCEYCDDMWSSKNCYLTISALEGENLYYSYRNVRCKDSCDLVFCFDCQNCYNLTNSTNCYSVFYGYLVENSSDSKFLYDCRNVRNCFMCFNLRNKEYCILNKQYSKEEYEKKMKEIDLGSRKEINSLQKLFQTQLKENALHRATMNFSCENVIGNMNTNCKNCENVALIQEAENCFNIIRGYKLTNCICTPGLMGDYCFCVCQSTGVYNVKFSSYLANCSDSEYLDNCQNCKNCFGCIGLKNKEYCILNKEYSREEYFRKVEKIKESMKRFGEHGKFFPYSMAYSGYNTTLARFYFPDTKENILKLGGYWEIDDGTTSELESYDLPDNIKDIDESFQSKAIKCTKTGKLFNFSKQVIDFHKKNNIPLPEVSHIERMVEMYYPLTFIKPYTGKCFITGENITHYYGPELGYKKIASNEAYDREING